MAIKNWPNGEKPREKLLQQGASQLLDNELLAILFKTGVQGKNAVELGRDLIIHYGSLQNLFNATLTELLQIKGIGMTKAVSIQAALELAKRFLAEELKNENLVENPKQVHQYLRARLNHRTQEIFACLFLDNSFRMINYSEMFYGTIDNASVYPREIIKKALSFNAAGLVLAHNHPRGPATPSHADKQVTKHLKQVLDIMNIHFVDHIIVGHENNFSFIENGLI